MISSLSFAESKIILSCSNNESNDFSTIFGVELENGQISIFHDSIDSEDHIDYGDTSTVYPATAEKNSDGMWTFTSVYFDNISQKHWVSKITQVPNEKSTYTSSLFELGGNDETIKNHVFCHIDDTDELFLKY